MGPQIGRGAIWQRVSCKKDSGLAIQDSATIGTHVAVKQVKKQKNLHMDDLRNEIIIWRRK